MAVGGICPYVFEIPLHVPCLWNKSPSPPPPVAKSNLHFQVETSHNDTASRGLLKIETELIKARVKESELRLVTGHTIVDRVDV